MNPSESDPAEDVALRVPLDMVHCECLDTLGTRSQHQHLPPLWHEMNRWSGGLPVLQLRSHQRLFSGFFEPDHPGDAIYRNWWRHIFVAANLEAPHSVGDQILGRYDQFLRLAFDLDQPKANRIAPPQAEYDAGSGRVVLRDGHHRAAFLTAARRRWITVRLSGASAAALLNPEIRDAVSRDFQRWAGEATYQPIEHPSFVSGPPHRDGFVPDRLNLIADALGYYRPRSVLDLGSNIGRFSRYFSRAGARVVGIEPQDIHLERADALNTLFDTRAEFRGARLQDAALGDEIFEVGLALTLVYHFMDDPTVGPAMVRQIDRHVSRFLFWETGRDPAEEIAFVVRHSGFKAYRRLAGTLGTGRVREIGVFARDEADLDNLARFDPYQNVLDPAAAVSHPGGR